MEAVLDSDDTLKHCYYYFFKYIILILDMLPPACSASVQYLAAFTLGASMPELKKRSTFLGTVSLSNVTAVLLFDFGRLVRCANVLMFYDSAGAVGAAGSSAGLASATFQILHFICFCFLLNSKDF